MKILNSQVYVGPNIYALFPVIRLTLDLGALEEWPTERLGRGFVDRLLETLPGLAAARLLLRRARRLRPPAARGRGHLARPRARACRDRAAERRRHAGHLRQDPRHRRARPVPRRLRVRAVRGRPGGRPAGAAAAPLAAAAGAAPGRVRRRAFRLRSAAATGSSASPRARRWGRARRRWWRRPKQRDIPWLRLNDQSLIQFGHGRFQQRIQATITSATPHIAVELASDKEETGQAARRPRPAGAQAAHGLRRRGRRLGRAAHRLPGGGQAAQRQPRPRRQHPPDGRGAGQGGVRHRPRAQPRRPGRELPRGPRPPPAGGQRRADRRLQAHARPRRRRRRAHGRASWSRS